MVHVKSYENVSKFVKFMPIILWISGVARFGARRGTKGN